MNRREFMQVAGITSVAGVSEIWASSIAFLVEPRRMDTSPDCSVCGTGSWRIVKAGDTIVFKLFDKEEKCFIEMGIRDFSPNVDYVRAMAPRKGTTPIYENFARMFGF